MKVKTYFDRSTRMWLAFLVDESGNIGYPAQEKTESEAIFALGREFGRHPEKFTRTIGEYAEAGQL